MNAVEEYLSAKNWDFKEVGGGNLAVECCPFCNSCDYKFFINADPESEKFFLWKCHKENKCGQQGNEWQLKKRLGDPLPERKGESDAKVDGTKKLKKVDPIPDVERMHQFLLDSQELVNDLTDNRRGWTGEVLTRMKVGFTNWWISESEDEEGNKQPGQILPCLAYPYFDGNKCVFVKFRTVDGVPRGFAALRGRDVPLYNANAIHDGMDYVICVEGEADTLSVLSIGEDNVVGIPGAGLNKAEWIDDLMKAKKRYLIFDNDEAGQRGAKKFLERFGEHKFVNVLLPEFDLVEPVMEEGELRAKGKDLGEWIRTGKTKEDLLALIRSVKASRIKGVSSTREGTLELIEEVKSVGNALPPFDTPWTDLNRIFPGGRRGQLIIIQAPMKTGKTSLVMNWFEHLTHEKEVNTHMEGEMSPPDLHRKWASYVTDTADGPGDLSTEQVVEMLEKAHKLASDREEELSFGRDAVTTVEAEMARMVDIITINNISVWAYDNLQYLVDLTYGGESKQGGRHSYISKVTKMFKEVAKNTNTLGVLIAQTKDTGEDGIATAKTLEGSRSPGNDCDYMMVLNRTSANPVKKASDLAALGDVQTNSTLRPQLYIEMGLARFGAGGICTLWMEGEKSKVRQLTLEERASLRAGLNTSAGKQDGSKIEMVSRKKPGPPPDFKVDTTVNAPEGVLEQYSSTEPTEMTL